MRTLAASPAALEAYLGFMKALGSGRLGPQLREQIALAVANANDCHYCIPAHTAVGKMLALADAELVRNLEGRYSDPKVEAALQFALDIVIKRGWVSDEDLTLVCAAGYDDGEVTEIIATVALNIFSNYFNHVADTEIDFAVQAGTASAAA